MLRRGKPFLRHLTGDIHLAEDVVQEAFVRLVGAWSRLEDHDKAEAYLRSTIVNLVRGDHRRREVAERRTPTESASVASAGIRAAA